MDIREITGLELNKALNLAWSVFLDEEAFGYNRRGVHEYRKFLDNKQLIEKFDNYGAYIDNELVGMMSVQQKQHICLFFVKTNQQKKGIGRALFEFLEELTPEQKITVNSSPIAINIYKSLGFSITDTEQDINGIKFTPMVYDKNLKKLKKIRCRDKEIILGKNTLIMGILNVTPDSFSDGGDHNGVESAVEYAKQLIEEGADIIDIGGESTRPGHTQISVEEEIKRIVPVIKKVVELGAIVSVDTYKYQVAEEAFKAGAHILNDVWGLQYDNGEMAEVVKKYDVPVIVMHNQKENDYKGDVIGTLKKFYEKSYDIAEKNNIDKDKILLDPGIGFAKGIEENLEILSRLNEIRSLGRVVLGTSRKRFIGTLLNQDQPKMRDIGTVATIICGIEKGVDIVRVHNVKLVKEAVTVADKIIRR